MKIFNPSSFHPITCINLHELNAVQSLTINDSANDIVVNVPSHTINKGNWTEWSAIWSEIIRLISKSKDRAVLTEVWFQTKIARPKVQLLLYYIHFEIAKFNSLNTRTTRFWSVPLYSEPVAGFSKSETRNAFTSPFENMSMSCHHDMIASCG